MHLLFTKQFPHKLKIEMKLFLIHFDLFLSIVRKYASKIQRTKLIKRCRTGCVNNKFYLLHFIKINSI